MSLWATRPRRTAPSNMLISFIFPTYNEQENIHNLYARLNKLAGELKEYDFEFILIDDCSSDNTQALLKKLREKDSRVKIIRFTKNFGGHKAITAGFKFCKGDCAVSMAADLQDPPELLKDLLKEWHSGAPLVWAVRKDRVGESFSTKFFSRFYYWLINRLTDIKVPSSGSDVFLADRKVIDAFNSVKETNTSVYLLLAWLGFKDKSIEYIKEARQKGRSNWTLKKKIGLLTDSLVSFSNFPARAVNIFGLFLFIAGLSTALLGILKVLRGAHLFLIALIFIISGIQFMVFGLLSAYLWRIYDESRGRPKYVIDYKMM